MNKSKLSVSTSGRLGILMPGLGAVASTVIAGVLEARRSGKAPVGALSQIGSVATANGVIPIRELVDLANLDDIVFGGWDPITANALEAASTAAVLKESDIAPISGEMEGVIAMDAVFDQAWVNRLKGTRVKTETNKWEQAQALIEDIERFRIDNSCDRLVMIWCASTEAYQEPGPPHSSIEAFENGLKNNDPAIAPSQIYVYAALQADVPFANGAPNLSTDLACMEQLSRERGVPIAGKDFKTGQTLLKTILAPGLRTRMLGLRGWYSTNILGNRDGLVLDDPANFKTKETSKLGVLDSILEPDEHPELYGDIDHIVSINYYPPRGDDKEGWDAIDIFGWMGYPMEIKVNFACRDSILAAPLVLDLALFMDLAARAGSSGVQEWLSFYFKAPQQNGDNRIIHDLFAQRQMLDAQLLSWANKAL